MGTDIHVFMERKHKGNWVPVHPPEYTGSRDYDSPEHDWHHFGRYAKPIPMMEQLAHEAMPFEDRVPSRAEEWHVSRDYMLFGNLANVRCHYDRTVFDEARGTAPDMSPAVEESIDGYHSLSWWQLDELASLRGAFPDDDEHISDMVKVLIEAMRTIAKDYNLAEDQVRMVFGFDS